MIDLTLCDERCYAVCMGECTILNTLMPCDYKCPFYKPTGCKDWVRVKDRLYTPEEFEELFKPTEYRHPAWRIKIVKE